MGILVIVIVIAAAVLVFGGFVERARLWPFWILSGRKLTPALRWLAILLAIPVGAIAGFLAIGWLSVAVLSIWSWGGPGNDGLTSLTLGLVGLLLGGTLLPWGISRIMEPPWS
jgi:hypothetical protein